MMKFSFVNNKVQQFLGVLVLVLFVKGCESNGEPELYLIPDDFIGRVIVVLNHPDGIAKKHEGELRYLNWMKKCK